MRQPDTFDNDDDILIYLKFKDVEGRESKVIGKLTVTVVLWLAFPSLAKDK